ncbi:MAG: LytR/AlgR family response regulator transcription factor [Flavobacterium sp.]
MIKSPYRYIIVDDEEIDRLTLLSFLQKHPQFEEVGIFSDCKSAEEFLISEKVDIAFLDIDIDGESGLELRKKLNEDLVCVFVTSHPEYALEGFELDALDFVVKPIRKERFEQTLYKINSYLETKEKALQYDVLYGDQMLIIKEGHEQVKIQLRDILYLEALKDYTLVVTAYKKHCILSNIGNLLKQDGFSEFIRIHRSYAVAKSEISKIGAQAVKTMSGFELPVGRSYKTNLQM